MKQYENKLHFFIGDVRDGEYLHRVSNEINYATCSSLKACLACEYNLSEAVKTNINDAM